MTEFRRGVRLGIDWGKARIGIAACDPDALLCYPVETLNTKAQPNDRIRRLCEEYDPIEVVLGMPIDLRGQEGIAAHAMGEVAKNLAHILPCDLRIVDERMSTASAAKKLAASGRSSRQRRSVIDQAAAVDILEKTVDAERQNGHAPGYLWSDKEEK